GGLLAQNALAKAVAAGQVGGAGIDVFESAPTTESELFNLPNVVVTPHLGASTAEAQDRAGTDVAHSVLQAMRGEFVPDAVNVAGGGSVSEELRPYLPLTQKLGTVVSALGQEAPASVTVTARGELADENVEVLQLAALRGVFAGVVEDPVTFVNAPQFAEERGVTVESVKEPESRTYRSEVTVRMVYGDGTKQVVSGAVTGNDEVQKLIEVNGRHFDLRAEGNLLLLEYPDRPGIMGRVGTLLGEAGINIEAAQISQTTDKADAIMLLRVDRLVDAHLLDPIGATVGAKIVRTVPFD